MAKMAFNPVLHLLEGAEGRLRVMRFWSLVDLGSPDECWDWRGSINTSGYGRFKAASYTTVGAHRFSLVLHSGEDHLELLALHSCDRPSCCNPHHLRWGTVQDNSDDMVSRCRQRSPDQAGFKNGACKLSPEHLALIVTGLLSGKNNKQIAEGLPVDHALVSRIRRGRSWAKEAADLGWTPQPKYAHLKRGSAPTMLGGA